jgi:RHH-type transcriptional regulator, proline utilization regulon repressor / proline dehydrogenase / delta 1-pyrroline-5-carboxylate dehydrogenase
MNNTELNNRVILQGKEIFKLVRNDKPSLFNKSAWMGKVMDWSMRNEKFKVQIFRFVDVFPALTTNKLLTEHIREYFGDEKDMPAVLSWGAKASGMLGAVGGVVMNKLISTNIHEMARQFIIGETTDEAVKNIEKLRRGNYATVVDVLGEATLSEDEAESYVATYLELLVKLKEVQDRWSSLGKVDGNSYQDWGNAPKINIAVKPSALYCQANPQDFKGSVAMILSRMRRIFAKVVEVGGFLCIDMESYRFKDITLEIFRRLKLEYPDYPYLGLVLQAYLRDTENDLDELLDWAKQKKIQISIRLVKGAYWDYETVKAEQNGWEAPVWKVKAESDAAFERLSYKILENHSICHFACASHNIRSISAVMETARELKVPEDRYEFQVLYGMAEPIRNSILKVAGRVRLYSPYGAMVPGMGYLVRRLLENTANESFLRQSFAEGAVLDRLLEDPATLVNHDYEVTKKNNKMENSGLKGLPPFANEPLADFTRKDVREAFPKAIADVRNNLSAIYPLHIDDKELVTTDKLPSVNPANPNEILGYVCQAGKEEVSAAIAAAKKAFSSWRDISPQIRAEYLIKAAIITRRRITELSAIEILEVGKQWDQAYADVAEAIDFLEYYAREMIRYGNPFKTGNKPGEENQNFYEPKGIAAIITPWNFPLAISMGMVSAAIVTGNTVVFKPSGLSPIIGYQLVSIYAEAGLPKGIFNYIPGRSSVMGDYLIDHPDISLIGFTGSMETGLRIIERAAKVHPGQVNVKKVVCEMGGKNAIIIDDDADLDEAVPHVLYSAFGFQGEKCSACSRLIVLDAVYEKFVARLVNAARAYKVGPAENPAYSFGAVIDDKAQKNINENINIGKQEGSVLYESPIPNDGGYYIPLTIIEGIKPENRIAQEEIFGPVLAIMRVKDFNQAIEWANSTRFALTGGVFSRSPQHIEQARREFRVGNLYINRNNTGAMVERQPFGGSRMSGTGTKAGGPDYLLHFMDPRVITENTMRRGFTPNHGKDEE